MKIPRACRVIANELWRPATWIIVAVGLLLMLSNCAGPQPLSVAMREGDEAGYVSALNMANGDARLAYARWMAAERGSTPDAVLEADATLSMSGNPFDARHEPEAISRGAVLYKLHCARCHGEDARGLGPSTLPDHRATNFKTFGKRFAATLHGGAPTKWFRVIHDGSGDVVTYPEGSSTAMPPFGQSLTREQTWLVITYLQSLDCYASKRESKS